MKRKYKENMTKEAQKIADEIKSLVDQLAAMSTIQPPGTQSLKAQRKEKKKKGAAGAISLLREEGFFDKPKDLSAIMGRLEEIGHYHRKTTISMNLLNLVKRRTFNRIKDSKTKNWLYVIRR